MLLGSFLLALFLAEGFLTVRSMLKYGGVNREELIKVRKERRDDDRLAGTADRDENSQVLHPFFGYTYNPKDKDINNFGFWTKYDVSLERSEYSIKDNDRNKLLVVGVFGGSFAGGIGSYRVYLEDKLKSVFPERNPIVMNFGVAGHALPQSALIYVYFKELFDVVVFIDGLNELWNYVENNRAGVPPEYAKAVHYIYKISRQELTPAQFERTSQIILLKRKIEDVTRLSLLPVIRQSLLVHHVWKLLLAHWSHKIAETSVEIVKTYEDRPKFFNVEDDAILTLTARQWGKYHKMIHHLTVMDGVLSIHLLQPNPFVPNSKILTREEQQRVARSFPVEPYVVNGYPKLQEEIGKLRAEGLVVEDLSNLFKSVQVSVWNDSAHVNETGRRLVADKVLQLILANRGSILAKRENHGNFGAAKPRTLREAQ